MKKIVFAAAAFTVVLAGTAFAEDSHSCGDAPKDKWMTVDQMKAKAKGLGLDVRRVKTEGSCYEVYAIDSKGQKVEGLYNPVTGESVGTESGE